MFFQHISAQCLVADGLPVGGLAHSRHMPLCDIPFECSQDSKTPTLTTNHLLRDLEKVTTNMVFKFSINVTSM